MKNHAKDVLPLKPFVVKQSFPLIVFLRLCSQLPPFFDNSTLNYNDIIFLIELSLQKLTLMRLPDKKMCYLMPLPKELSTPEKLIRDLERVSQVRLNT